MNSIFHKRLDSGQLKLQREMAAATDFPVWFFVVFVWGQVQGHSLARHFTVEILLFEFLSEALGSRSGSEMGLEGATGRLFTVVSDAADWRVWSVLTLLPLAASPWLAPVQSVG